MKVFSLKHELRHFHKEIFLGARDAEKGEKSPFLINEDIGRFKSSVNSKLRILIDCASCMDRLNGGFYPEAVSGGQWTTLYQFYNQIRQACAQDDLEVIFFLDGTSAKSLEEQEEWLYKQFRISRQVKILYESFSPLRKPHSRHFTQPIFLADWIRYNANNIRANEPKNTFSFQSIDDHQMEILDFSRQFKCDILFTNDLNVIALYLINQKFANDREKIKNTVLFEASSFKLSKSSKEFTGSRYDFPAILKSYNMEPEEFALFLVLLGHKFVSSSTLDFFYQREAYVTEEYLLKESPFSTLKKNLDVLINLVNDVKKYVNRLPKPIDFLRAIGSVTQNYQEAKFTAKELQRSIDYFKGSIPTQRIYWFFNEDDPNYCLNKSLQSVIGGIISIDSKFKRINMDIDNLFQDELNKLDPCQKFLNRIKIMTANSMITPWIYQILTKQKHYISTTLEPLNQHNQVRADKIFKPIREYLYKVIFSGFDLLWLKNLNETTDLDYAGQITVEELTFDSKSEELKADQLTISPHILGELLMERLWHPDCVWTEKFTSFLNSVQARDVGDSFSHARDHMPNNKRPVFTYDDDFFVPCCVLRYMIQTERLLCAADIDAFLITFVFTKSNQHISYYNTEFRDSRAMHIGNLFMRGIENFSFANDVCGNPINASHFHIGKVFNGVFFQLSYSNCQSNNKEFFESLCANEFIALTISSQVETLKKLVHYKLEDKVSKSQENVEFHSIRQYESKYQVSKITNRNKGDWLPSEKSLNKDLNNNTFRLDNFKIGEDAKNSIFLREQLERNLLDEKISPKNNNKGYMGRGILARIKQSLPIARSSLNNDFDIDDEDRGFSRVVNQTTSHALPRTPQKNKSNNQQKNQSNRANSHCAANNLKPKGNVPKMRDYSTITFLRFSSDSETDLSKMEECNKDRKSRIRCSYTERL